MDQLLDLMSTNPNIANISDVRRDNLRALKARHGGLKLANLLGLAQSSFISQMAGPRPTREVTEKTVRTLERELNLELGSLDQPMGSVYQAPPATAEENIAMISATIRAIGNICTDESVDLPTSKLTDIISLAIVDAMEHGGKVREDHIRQVVRLLK
jgi:hypothetical protein